jgi:RNA polymerase sigma-70 factor (ECF subfamily)
MIPLRTYGTAASRTPPDDPTELDAIVCRAQLGDVAAFELLYRANAEAVFALCRRMVGDERDARELTQDVFVRAWERLTQFRGHSSIGTWLHRIAVNIALTHLRVRKRDDARLVDDDHLPNARATDSQIHSRLDLDAALARLPEGARVAFILHDVEGFSHDEIAQMTGNAPGTARAQLWRARRALMTLLEP